MLIAPYTVLATGVGITALGVALLFVLMASGDRAQRQAAEAIAERDRSERSLQLLAEHVPVGIVDLDAGGEVRWMNSHLRKLLGLACARGDGEPLTWPLHVHPDGADVVEERWRHAFAASTALTARRRILRLDGEERWIDERGAPILDDEGESVRWVVSVNDVDAKVEFERQLQSARDQALEVSRLKSEFLAKMSHEIRTPLNGIIGMADLLLDTQLDAEQRERVATLRQAAWQQLDLLNDLLDLSKVEAGRLTLEHIAFSPRDLVTDVVRLYSSKAYDKGVVLVHEFADGVPAEVFGDPVRLRQIISNLVGNAIKFTPRGSVEVRLGAEASDPDRVQLRFDVVDSGIGISPDAQLLLFQPFTQADTSTTRTYGGTGLGLAICRQLADLMDARLELESTEGVGSRFSLVVPLEVAAALPVTSTDATPPAPQPLPVRTPANGSRHGQRLLLVEDNTINQPVAQGLLSKLGWEVVVAADGIEALNAFSERPYDVVFMDCQMPRMDGLEATTRLRRLPGGERTHVIAMTASAMDGDRERCLEAGMDDYLVKPVTLEALEAALRRAPSVAVTG